ncbi:MAG: DNA repair protein RecO [Candidatus Fimimonas sp.]
MDVTTKAVALRATDYKENDKMVLLYSLEYGKISVHAKGVRKNTAKLKFACDQFCFGQYELAQNGERFTLKTCQQLESFYNVREDVFAYYAACTVAECLINYTEEGQSEAEIFVVLLRALQQLANNVEPLLVTLKFLLDFLALDGFKLDFSRCAVCGQKNVKMFLDTEKGGAVCDECRSVNSFAVSARVVSTCKMLDGLPYDKLKNLTFTTDILKESLATCEKYVSHSFFPLKSLSELLKLA